MSLLTFLFCLIASFNSQSVNEKVKLTFTITQSIDTYEQSMFGEPPQIAIWLENTKDGSIKTVYVTRRTGEGDYEGKMQVNVALPAWILAFRKETGRNDFPTPFKPVVDGLTGATTQQETISREVIVDKGVLWNYYIEVNVAGDFNANYPNYKPNGELDPNLNGQPSIVYKGQIRSGIGQVSTPTLVGRTEQIDFPTNLVKELTTITTAKDLLKHIEVACVKK